MQTHRVQADIFRYPGLHAYQLDKVNKQTNIQKEIILLKKYFNQYFKQEQKFQH